ncbi:MAG: AAA family ATPase [Nocardioides sp.]
MIFWLNGTFGSGKTTTAGLLVERNPRLRLFDPEWVGFMLRANLADQECTDFQELPSWRVLTPVVIDEVARATGQHLVVVQTVLVEQYWRELQDRLLALDHAVVHVVLEAEESVMRARIDADEVEVGARAWRLDHLAPYAAARPWLAAAADRVLDTTDMSPEVAAGAIADLIS